MVLSTNTPNKLSSIMPYTTNSNSHGQNPYPPSSDDDKPLLSIQKNSVKVEYDSSGDEISLLDIKRSLNGSSNSNSSGNSSLKKPKIIHNAVPASKRKFKREASSSESSDDDLPLSAIRPNSINGNSLKKPRTEKFLSYSSISDSDSDVALSMKISKAKAALKPKKMSKSLSKPISKSLAKARAKEPTPATSGSAKIAAKTIAKSSAATSKKSALSKSQSTQSFISNTDDQDSEDYKWWLESNKDDSIKWTTLAHNGVWFPPDYLPHGHPILYDGKPVYLEPEIEELVGFYAALLETDHARNKIFQKNFFNEFKKLMSKSKKKYGITDFAKCDFSPMHQYFTKLKEEKKLMTKDEKQALKDEKLRIDTHYGTCTLDGRLEKVGNFRIEPPGLFRGRGAHPKAGCYKKRVLPEQITINIGEEAPVPAPPSGHSWGSVIHDQTVTWLAMWKENVNDSIKYVFLAAGSSIKGQSDLKKYEKARALKDCVAKIRKDYTFELASHNLTHRQRATALYLIDRLALRAGNEKGEDQADTVGCCSLRYEHIELIPPKKVVFDFLGKDSIRYYNEVDVSSQVFKNLVIFKKNAKSAGNMIFDKISTIYLNKHLSSLMPGLSAKVFRTYNASYTFQKELESTPKGASIPELLLAYNRANRQVAILCNHQKTVTKSFDDQMYRMTDKINALQYTRQRHLHQLKSVEPKAHKLFPKLFEITYDNFSEEWLQKYHLECVLKEKEKINKKIDKLKEDKEGKKTNSEAIKALEQDLKQQDEIEKKIIKGKHKPGHPLPQSANIERISLAIEKLDARILAAETNKVDKDENKTTALGTSKINYIDPRISIAWCQKHDVPIDKIFNRTLKEKFKWAFEVDSNWTF